MDLITHSAVDSLRRKNCFVVVSMDPAQNELVTPPAWWQAPRHSRCVPHEVGGFLSKGTEGGDASIASDVAVIAMGWGKIGDIADVTPASNFRYPIFKSTGSSNLVTPQNGIAIPWGTKPKSCDYSSNISALRVKCPLSSQSFFRHCI